MLWSSGEARRSQTLPTSRSLSTRSPVSRSYAWRPLEDRIDADLALGRHAPSSASSRGSSAPIRTANASEAAHARALSRGAPGGCARRLPGCPIDARRRAGPRAGSRPQGPRAADPLPGSIPGAPSDRSARHGASQTAEPPGPCPPGSTRGGGNGRRHHCRRRAHRRGDNAPIVAQANSVAVIDPATNASSRRSRRRAPDRDRDPAATTSGCSIPTEARSRTLSGSERTCWAPSASAARRAASAAEDRGVWVSDARTGRVMLIERERLTVASDGQDTRDDRSSAVLGRRAARDRIWLAVARVRRTDDHAHRPSDRPCHRRAYGRSRRASRTARSRPAPAPSGSQGPFKGLPLTRIDPRRNGVLAQDPAPEVPIGRRHRLGRRRRVGLRCRQRPGVERRPDEKQPERSTTGGRCADWRRVRGTARSGSRTRATGPCPASTPSRDGSSRRSRSAAARTALPSPTTRSG